MKKLAKRLFGALCAVMLVVGCTNPLEDEIKVIEEEFAFAKDLEYRMTDDDYETLDEICDCTGFGNFGSEDDAKDNIPFILADVYPGLGDGSSAVVTYDLFRGRSSDVNPWLDAVDDRYELAEADYAVASAEAGDAGFFNNTTTFEDNVSDILNAGFASPTDGQTIAVTYDYSSLEYNAIDFTSAYSEDFTSITDLSVSDFDIYDLGGAQGWVKYVSSYPYEAANMSGFSGGANANEDWLVSPAIDLTGFDEAELRIEHVVNFLDALVFGTDLAIRVSTDYDGLDPVAATWNDLTFDSTPAGDSWDPVTNTASLAAYADQTIYISFYYKSTDAVAPNWRVIDIAVGQGEEVDTDTYNVFYSYDAGSMTWSEEDGAYFMSSPDFDAFGFRFPNFSSSDRAENYLPQFLATSLRPFAQEDDTQIVIYDYFSSSSGVQVRGDLLTFTGGEWVVYQSVIETVLNFGHNGTEWVADNTIKYTLGSDDYSSIAAAYATSNPDGSSSMTTFGNYDLTLWSSQEIFDSITARLEALYGSIEAGQKFLVDYAVWRPGSGVDQLNVIYDGTTWSYVTE